jgi:hypothetical protein
MMISMGDSGFAKTRTWGQGFMINRILLKQCNKVEETLSLFRCRSRPAVPAEPIPNFGPKFGSVSPWKVEGAHRVAGPNRPNRDRTAGIIEPGWWRGRHLTVGRLHGTPRKTA